MKTNILIFDKAMYVGGEPKLLQGSELLALYNALSDKPTKRFGDKKAAIRRTSEVILGILSRSNNDDWSKVKAGLPANLRKLLNPKLMPGTLGGKSKQPTSTKPAEVKKAKPKTTKRKSDNPTAKLERMTAKEKLVLNGLVRHAKTGLLEIDQLASSIGGDSKIVKDILGRLVNMKAVQIVGTRVQAFEHSAKWMTENHPRGKGIPPVDLNKRDHHHPGRRSVLSGKTIAKMHKCPWRENTHGWNQWKIMKVGMTYEEFIQDGGIRKFMFYAAEWGNLELK